MVRIALIVCGIVLAVWLVLAWQVFGTFTAALPDTGHSVRDRVEAVEAAKAGRYYTAATIQEAAYGTTVALRGTLSMVGKTGPSQSVAVVDGVTCFLLEHVHPKRKAGESVIVGGKWDGRRLRECMLYSNDPPGT